MNGVLNKMKILAFLDCNYQIPAGVYVAQVNPESYNLKYSVEYDKTQAQGTSGKNAVMNLKRPDKLTFEFLFDSTGVIDAPISVQSQTKELGVEADILLFKKFLFGFDSETHRTRFLILHWGTLLFKCVMTSLDVNYTLFKPNGVPIRAIASASFQGSIPDLLREAIEKFSSPDLTHVRVIKDSDSIYNLCDEIYGDASLYVKVAEANGITNFRNLKTGSKLYFPPIAENQL